MRRETLTDTTTDDQVVIHYDHHDSLVTIEPAEAIVLGQELIALALELTIPDSRPTVHVAMEVKL